MHARAIVRLDLAADDRKRLNEVSDAARGGAEKRTAAVALAAANEQLAAREASSLPRYSPQGTKATNSQKTSRSAERLGRDRCDLTAARD